MKKKLLFSLALVCTLGFFSSCSDDDEKFIFGSVPVSFSGEKLELSYSGAAMPGKEVIFSTADGKIGQLEMKGKFDIKEIVDAMGGKTQGKDLELGDLDGLIQIAKNLQVPGVVPGEVSTIIKNIPLTVTADNKYTFSGVDSQNGRSFSFDGTVEIDPKANATVGTAGTEKMVLKLTEVQMPANTMLGKWNLPKYGWNAELKNYEGPIHVAWEAKDSIEIELFPGVPPMVFPPQALLGLALQIPLLGDVNMYDALSSVLNEVELKKDGNVIAQYKAKEALKDPNAQWMTSPMNIAHYAAKNDSVLHLYLNPSAIIANVKTKGAEFGMPTEVIMQVVKDLLPMLSTGFPLKYRHLDIKVKGKNEAGEPVENIVKRTIVCADLEILAPLLKALTPMLENDKLIAQLVEEIKKNPEMAAVAPMVEGVLKQLPAVLKSTNRLELGLYLAKAN